MTNKDLFNAFENTSEKFIAEASPKPRKKGIIIKAAASVACVCLIAAAGIITLKHNSGISKTNGSSGSGSVIYDGNYTPGGSVQYDGDYTPNGNYSPNYSGSKAESSETEYTAKIPSWDELTLPERFSEAEISSARFSGRNKTLPAGKIGDRISALTLTGRDEITKQSHTAKAEAFEIKGISAAAAAAVKFSGTNEYYVYTNPYYQPETLGQFIADLDLKNTLSCGTVYENRFTGKKEYTEAQYTGLTEKGIFENLLSDGSIPAVKDYDSKFFGSELIGISVSIELLGYKNISLAVTEDGYITTNILDTGKAFFIGRQKAEEFYKYVTRNCRRTKYEVTKSESASSRADESGDSTASHAVSHNIPE